MHKFFRHTAVAALAAILAAGPSTTALAAQDDSNTGPAFDNTVSLEAPGSDATTGPGVSGPASEQGTGASRLTVHPRPLIHHRPAAQRQHRESRPRRLPPS